MKTLDRESVLKAVAGKAIERGLLVEEQGDALVVRYDDPTQQEADHLHRQALRSLVQRFRNEGRINPDSKIHTLAVNNGFVVRVEQLGTADDGVRMEEPTPELRAESSNGEATSEGELQMSSDEIVAFLRKLLAS